MTQASLLNRRARVMGPTYRLFYDEPLHLVRGKGVHLFDPDGRQYLDCYNNVASVGHCHPHVVEAISRQAATLNTHTRYLHENVVEYAERLTATLPDPLSVCLFVCTGTEANDLAFRMARTVTGNLGALVTEHAYHGNSLVVTELSTEEYPASQRPDYLEAVAAPDSYRGLFLQEQPNWAQHYVENIDAAIARLQQRSIKPALFMCDNIFSSNGILTPPPEYLQGVYRQVRAAGGLIVADEVQSGLGRLGNHLWGFEDSAVIPDIVTMGKPIGNGHPLAAVVTTPEIAEEFSRQFSYFNTFGGNPVSAAAGLAVLDVVEQEHILQNVNTTGTYLLNGLKNLADQCEWIGDIRGKGLFLGLDLVSDRKTRTPDSQRAQAVRESLRQNGVLLGTTGPHNNVLKIRPPMVFQQEHADQLLDKLQAALQA